MIRPTLALLLLGLPTVAMAQDAPRLEPSRDVTVTYRLVGEAPPAGQAAPQVVLSWSQARRAVRIDHPGGNWMVADLNGRRGFMVSDPQRQMMNLPPPPTEGGLPGLIPPGGRFVRGETERVANTECTVWRVEMPDNSQGRTCITTDGVVLRSVGSAGPGQPEQGLEAVSVSYAPQAASRFSPPNGYRTVQPPPQQGGAPGGPPAGPPPGNPPRR